MPARAQAYAAKPIRLIVPQSLKTRPGEINYVSNGIGSSTHFATEMFRQLTVR